MFSFLLRKLIYIVPTLIGASLIAFVLIRLVPGDPVVHLLGERGGDPQVVAEMKAKFGLDLPIWQQYFKFISNAITGDMGVSTVSKRPVNEEFMSRFPATLELAMAGLFWAILIGIPIGIFAAIKKNSWFDYTFVGASLVGYSMPIFWWGLILILVFSVGLGWFPVSGRIDVQYDISSVTGLLLIDVWFSQDSWPAFKSALNHLILPAFVLGTVPLAVIVRMTRASMIEVLSEDFMRALRAKGISFKKLILKHALRNAIVPIFTVIGLLMGSLLTGAVLTETIFSWPGIGRWIYKSVEARDYPVIQTGVLYLAGLIVFVNLFVDMLYYWAWPRMRNSR
jgi:dipeptide transport system permease protein